MSELINIEAFYSPLTEHSPVQISAQQTDPCSHEIELNIGFDSKGFVCTTKTMSVGLHGVVKYYRYCQTKNGQCPLDRYQEFSIPDSYS